MITIFLLLLYVHYRHYLTKIFCLLMHIAHYTFSILYHLWFFFVHFRVFFPFSMHSNHNHMPFTWILNLEYTIIIICPSNRYHPLIFYILCGCVFSWFQLSGNEVACLDRVRSNFHFLGSSTMIRSYFSRLLFFSQFI